MTEPDKTEPDKAQPEKTEPQTAVRKTSVVDAVLQSPLAGLSPWILLSLLSGPGRFEESAAAALGLSLLILAASHRRGGTVKLLEVFDVVFFGVLAAIGLLASANTIRWFELWGGELTNIALVVFAFGSILLRNPFTLQYAKESTPEEYWTTPLFLRINYVITAVWALAFTWSAAVGLFGDALLHDGDNFWTGWILQLLGTFFAISFTEWYPEYAPNKAAQAQGLETEPPQSIFRLFDFLPVFVAVTGIAGLVTDSVSVTAGVTLILVGVFGHLAMRRFTVD
ncbi:MULTISPECIES: hypothetical protein [Rhodococcus]|uniref:Uncharacterized protein n=2 Tax=Rhodococcus erythropolis TaxID=1833 RepID=A0A0C2ZU80_RHOER|nr:MULTISPECIES: hypothetical protein [Rhodococcus]ERB52615.1 membrane protein [Rhodococcus sp. P27]MCD2155940.1 hypothetical protein [Rhodococcus cerastii]NRH33091.1 hypothetical protein [Rhodococcus sp. MS13]AKD97822.1 membrane protein [Rhodococcus erythropolis]EQM31868.1 membrane protein [Rhodococcus erythropolis DN1]